MFHDDRFPSEEQQLHFCRAYIAAMQQLLQQDGAAAAEEALAPAGAALAAAVVAGGGGGGSAAAARLLATKAVAHVPLSHLMWALWGLIQAKTSDVEFDYRGYATQRIQRYHATKRAVLA